MAVDIKEIYVPTKLGFQGECGDMLHGNVVRIHVMENQQQSHS